MTSSRSKKHLSVRNESINLLNQSNNSNHSSPSHSTSTSEENSQNFGAFNSLMRSKNGLKSPMTPLERKKLSSRKQSSNESSKNNSPKKPINSPLKVTPPSRKYDTVDPKLQEFKSEKQHPSSKNHISNPNNHIGPYSEQKPPTKKIPSNNQQQYEQHNISSPKTSQFTTKEKSMNSYLKFPFVACRNPKKYMLGLMGCRLLHLGIYSQRLYFDKGGLCAIDFSRKPIQLFSAPNQTEGDLLTIKEISRSKIFVVEFLSNDLVIHDHSLEPLRRFKGVPFSDPKLGKLYFLIFFRIFEGNRLLVY